MIASLELHLEQSYTISIRILVCVGVLSKAVIIDVCVGGGGTGRCGVLLRYSSIYQYILIA